MNYWLVKSEPDDFSFTDLKRQGREPWTGVRNYQARNYMRDQMQPGDLVLFYHSNVNPTGIVGIAQVDSKSYTDPTQFNSKSDYFDPTSTTTNPRWQLVDLIYKESLPRMVTLAEIKADPLLRLMVVAKQGTRLSITPVAPEHFQRIHELAHQKAHQ